MSSPFPASGQPILFLPGWGFDQRLAGLLPCVAGCELLPLPGFSHPDLGEKAAKLLTQQDFPVHLCGWSMGANLACSLAASMPSQVASLTMIALRPSWPEQELAAISAGLATGWQDYMVSFYRKCFLGQKKVYSSFSSQLQKSYLATLRPELLAEGLTYLANYQWPQLPADLPVQLVHGRKDLIAPYVSHELFPSARQQLLEHEGHFPVSFAWQ